MSEITLTQAQAKQIGERIRDARRQAGYYQQAALADAINLSVGYIAKLESGNQVPRDDEIYRTIATFLGVPVAWLLTGGGDAPAPERPSRPAAVGLAEESTPYDARSRLRTAVGIACRLLYDERARQAIDTLAEISNQPREDILWDMVKKELER